MQACSTACISVPEEVAIVGIDNDPLTYSLLRIGFSSVRQGITVHSILLKHRLEVACDLLRNSDLTLVEISKRSGFNTTQYMHVAFKRELATTPSEWRARAMN